MVHGHIQSADTFVNVPGGTIFVRRWSAPAASRHDPLILLHDSLGCVELWRDFPAVLSRHLDRPVVAYDRLGFGRSSERRGVPTAAFIREEAEEVFPVVRSELGIAGFALFGHSVGGAMALTVAARAGESCRAVVSESAQAFVEDRTVSGVRAAKTQFQQPERFDKLKRWHGAKAQWVLDAWTGVWLSPEFASWSLEPDLPLVTCPTLVIHGDQDEYGSIGFPQFICRHAAGRAEMHILKGCGHVPHREHQDAVTNLVGRFPPLSEAQR